MTEGQRPGGLTALAVINFVFAAFGLLGILGFVALLAILHTTDVPDEDVRKMKEAFEQAGLGVSFLVFLLSVAAVATVLQIVSGVGYLKQKKFLGRTLGNTYAAVSIASNIVTAAIMPSGAGGGVNLGTLIGLVYPILTLILLNTTFRDDFIY